MGRGCHQDVRCHHGACGRGALTVGAPADLIVLKARNEMLSRPQFDRVVVRGGRAMTPAGRIIGNSTISWRERTGAQHSGPALHQRVLGLARWTLRPARWVPHALLMPSLRNSSTATENANFLQQTRELQGSSRKTPKCKAVVAQPLTSLMRGNGTCDCYQYTTYYRVRIGRGFRREGNHLLPV
jgi:hypothetical protein